MPIRFPRARATSIAAVSFAVGFVLVALPARAQTVSVWLTTDDSKSLLAPQSPLAFATRPGTAPVIVNDEAAHYQTIVGFGASMTDSSAYLLNQKVPPAALDAVMMALFDRKQGIGVSFLRNPMGASDLARFHYSYDDLTPGSTDASLASFSITHDNADILPLLRQAKAINPQLKLMGSPWSPPGWMKTSGSMVGGSLLPADYNSYANYFVKYLQAYAAAGAPVDYISLQNEPLFVPSNYPGMSMDGATQATVLKNYVLPALAAAQLNTQVLIYDHNWDNTDYAKTILADPALANSPLIGGIAWHWYGGIPSSMTALHQIYPNQPNFVTEASGGTWVNDEIRTDFETIIHSLRNWSNSFIKWGLALDTNRGPNAGGCNTCTPLVTVNQATGAVSYPADYYTLGHFSKFAQPGALRLYSNDAAGLLTVAFSNPDGSRSLVVYNDTPAAVSATRGFQVNWNGRYFSYTLPAYAGASFSWNVAHAGTRVPMSNGRVVMTEAVRPPQSGRILPPDPIDAATQRVQASSYYDISQLQTESCSDTDGGFDLGYSATGSYAVYNNIDFGSGVSSVDVRSASGGSGGTLEFRLDSATGPLIASARLPVSGGWQTWQTNTASVTGAAGVHNLYVVFAHAAGNGGIANLNWFQFH